MFIELDAIIVAMKERMNFLLYDRGMMSSKISELISPESKLTNIYSKWISGRKTMRIRRVIAIIEQLDVSIDYAIFGKGSKIKLSELYSPLLDLNEKDLFVYFQNLQPSNKELLLALLKEKVPQNAFTKFDFMKRNGEDYQKANEEIEALVVGLGSKLETLLKENKIQKKRFAEEIGIHFSLVTKIIKGERLISLEMLVAICQFFKMLPSDLLGTNVQPDRMEGFQPDASDLIVYFRMLDVEEKGEILAISKAMLDGIPVVKYSLAPEKTVIVERVNY